MTEPVPLQHIVVLVKQVPDSSAPRVLRPDDGTVDRDNATLVINEMDEYAIEEALQVAERHGADVTVLTMGPDGATEAIRRALSLGAQRATHISDDALHGSDAVATARVLAAALATLQWDLVLCGAEATDGQLGALPAMLAELTGATQLTGARSLTIDSAGATIERQLPDGFQRVSGPLPAIVSVWDTINEPRYPSFKGIMQAKNRPITTLSLTDLQIDPASVGLAAAATEVVTFTPRPPRAAGTKLTADDAIGETVTEFLATNKLI